MTTLEFLALEGNSLNAGFTRELCELKNLIALTMLDNDLVGLVPECLSGLTKLQLLVLSNNQFSQRLPDLSDMTELRFLYLDDNQFTGDLTTVRTRNASMFLESTMLPVVLTIDVQTFNKMSDLRVLYLDDNEFHGVIDEDFMKDHAELRRVDISGNEFNGTFPGHFFENSPELQVLDIHDNRFEGPLPTTISNHSSMLLYVPLVCCRVDLLVDGLPQISLTPRMPLQSRNSQQRFQRRCAGQLDELDQIVSFGHLVERL